MLALTAQQEQPIDVYDREGRRLGHVTAHHHGAKVRLCFHGLDDFRLERRPIGDPDPTQPRKTR